MHYVSYLAKFSQWTYLVWCFRNYHGGAGRWGVGVAGALCTNQQYVVFGGEGVLRVFCVLTHPRPLGHHVTCQKQCSPCHYLMSSTSLFGVILISLFDVIPFHYLTSSPFHYLTAHNPAGFFRLCVLSHVDETTPVEHFRFAEPIFVTLLWK